MNCQLLMVLSKAEIKEQDRLLSEMEKRFPEFPVRLYESPSDQRCIWVKVFCVPENLHERVQDFIVSLQDQFEKCLLPNVIATKGYENGGYGYSHNRQKGIKRKMRRMETVSK